MIWVLQHGLLMVILISVIWPIVVGLPRWIGNARWLPFLTHAGRRYEQREHLHKGHRQSLRLSTLLRFQANFSLRPVGWLEDCLVGAGLVRAGGVGRSAFDARWFLECRGDDAVPLFDEALIEAVEAFALGSATRGYRLRRIDMEGLKLHCEIDRDRGDGRLPVMEFVGLFAPVVESLNRALEQGAQPLVRQPPRRSGRGFNGLLVVLVALGWWGMLRSYGGPDLIEPARAFVDSLWFGVPLALGVVGSCWLAFRSDRRGARLLGRMLLIGAPAALLSGHTLLREGNILLDRAEPQTVSLPRAQVLWTRAGKRGYTTWITLPPVPGRTTEPADVTIRHGLAAGMRLGWPPSSLRVALEVEVMPGRFGYAWVRRIRRTD